MFNVDIPLINHFYLGRIDFIEYPLLNFGVEVTIADSRSPWPLIGVSAAKSHVLMKRYVAIGHNSFLSLLLIGQISTTSSIGTGQNFIVFNNLVLNRRNPSPLPRSRRT
jgi:hypothetical protein